MEGNEKALLLASLGFLAAAIGDWFATRGYTWVTGRTAERMLLALRIRIFAHLQRLSLDFYDRELAGRVMTRMTTDVEALSQLVQTGLITAFVSVLTCVGVLVWLVILSPPLALAASVVLPPLVLATIWYRRRAVVTYEQARDRISELNADFQESLSGVRIGQAFGQEERNITRFRAFNGRYLDARFSSQKLIAMYFPFVMLLADLAAAFVLGTGRVLAEQGVVTAGVVIAFILYLDQFFSPIQQLSQVFDTWQQAAVSMDRITELMATPSLTPEAAEPIEPPPLRGGVVLDDVDFAYANTGGLPVLTGLDLQIAARRERRPRRRDRSRQVDGHEADRPVLRRHRGHGARRRPRRPRPRAQRLPSSARHRAAGGVPVHRHAARQHRLRPPRRQRRRGGACGASRRRARHDRPPPGRLSHRRQRTRPQPVVG